MPYYEYRCDKCGTCFAEVSVAYAGTDAYVHPQHCGVLAERLISLPAKRSSWCPTVSRRYNGKPIEVTGADHDKQLRRKMGLVSADEEKEMMRRINSKDKDPDHWDDYVKETTAKAKEAKAKGVSAAAVNMPEGRPYGLSEQEQNKKEWEAFEPEYTKIVKESFAEVGQ